MRVTPRTIWERECTKDFLVVGWPELNGEIYLTRPDQPTLKLVLRDPAVLTELLILLENHGERQGGIVAAVDHEAELRVLELFEKHCEPRWTILGKEYTGEPAPIPANGFLVADLQEAEACAMLAWWQETRDEADASLAMMKELRHDRPG